MSDTENFSLNVQPDFNQLTILVIDSDEEWAEKLLGILQGEAGLTNTHHCGSLEQTNLWLSNHTPSLIVFDLTLPDSSGLMTLQRIKEKAPEASLIILTEDADQEIAVQALRQGAQDCMIKSKVTTVAIVRVTRYTLERKTTEDRNRIIERLLAHTLDALPACIAILNKAGQIQAVNTAWREYSDADNPLIHGCGIGTNYLELCDRLRDQKGRLQHVANGILNVTGGAMNRFHLDYPVIPATRQAWYELIVTKFSSAQATNIVVFHQDISKRKELESKLRKSEELFSIISHNVMDLMAIVDINGHRLYSSPSYSLLLGYSPEEMLQLSADDIVHPDDRQIISSALEQVFRTGEPQTIEYRIIRKDGSLLHFESKGVLIANSTAGTPQALIVARDITQRKTAESSRDAMELELRHAQKLEAIGQLAAGIAHEINTPTQYIGDNINFLKESFNDIQTIINEQIESLGLAAEGGLSSEQAAKSIQHIKDMDYDFLAEEIPKAIKQSIEGVARVSKIVGAMKDFSRIGGDVKEQVDINRAIESTTTVSRNEWKYYATIELDFDPELPLTPCYPGDFNQVILNLIVNAAHAIQEKMENQKDQGLGVIRISTRNTGNETEIRVADSGTGMPEHVRKRIFDPFFTTKPVGKGTGQGLSIVRSIVIDKHGGKIEVETEEGKGTTFILKFPL